MTKSNQEMDITIEYRNIKNINMYVKAPDGHILVTAPRGTSKRRIMKFVDSKQEWIIKTRKRIVEQSQNYYDIRKPSKQEINKLKEQIAIFAEKWEPIMSVHASKWSIRFMKTRWGSCNVNTGSININSRLVYYPIECLEYIVVHELCHLIEPSHNSRFKKYMGIFLPDWKDRKNLLYVN
ncbi:MAG: M48 family metallopeptidase [Suipraeoptans sp.]